MKIDAIDKNSPLYQAVSPGAKVVKVNGYAVSDELDFHFYNTEETLTLEIVDNGDTKAFTLDGYEDIGLSFEPLKIKTCKNKCIFCFVHQQPKGMRRSLYVKDDDYRFSFTHGNYITLSGMTDEDYERIISQRLSPLYISVHATDDTLRRCIFKNEKLDSILKRLRQLIDNGITVHTQTVVCPEVNDGKHLEKTIADLIQLAPGVESLAVVPVGLTKYRHGLPQLRVFTENESAEIINLVEKYQKQCRGKLGYGFVYPADEFFLSAKRPLPRLRYYDDMPQFENGVGMARQFIVDFNRRRRFLPAEATSPKTLTIITGRSAESFMREDIVPYLEQIGNLTVRLVVVENAFWGETVTVSGLLTGKDILKAIKGHTSDVLFLPPNCLNTDNLFLDNVSLREFTRRAKCPVVTGTYDIAGMVRQVLCSEAI